MLESVKLALRVSTSAFDAELNDMIDAAKADLRLCGVLKVEETDPLIKRAVILYCKSNFGSKKRKIPAELRHAKKLLVDGGGLP